MAIVLVVDDSAVSRHMLKYTLCRHGYDVLAAAGGHEALQLLATTTVDVVIADLIMPDMDGLALLSAIRSESQLSSLHMLMLTSSGQEADRQQAEVAGASAFLTKPASSQDLIGAVERLLAKTSR